MHDFRSYVRTRLPTESARGDFVRDVKADSAFPAGKTWEEVRSYLWSNSACPEAIGAGRRLFREWEQVRCG